MPGGEGSTFGKYFLLKKIASGGMGEIFLAKLKGPVGFEKLLVIKRILAQHVENQEFVDMFFAEARVAAQLNHANVVQIYEMGEIEDAFFIAMEYVHGKSLRDIIDRMRDRGEYVHPAHTIEIISRVCEGMSYAHNATDIAGQPIGIVHRDINPHNLLVSYSGEVKVIDFGIAKSEMSLHKTEAGTIKGKFVYMSPEQSAAERLDRRSDLFSIGICLYETLAGYNPFAKANIVLSLEAIQRGEPPPITETSQKLAPFVPILARALAKKAADRYSDCLEMRSELQRLVSSGTIEKPRESLSVFMRELFEDVIESEKRMILETDQASSEQIERMRDFRRLEHRSGSYNRLTRPAPAPEPQDAFEEEAFDEAAQTGVVALELEERSRLPFYLILCALIAATVVAAMAVYKVMHGKRLLPSSPLELAAADPSQGPRPPALAGSAAGSAAAPIPGAPSGSAAAPGFLPTGPEAGSPAPGTAPAATGTVQGPTAGPGATATPTAPADDKREGPEAADREEKRARERGGARHGRAESEGKRAEARPSASVAAPSTFGNMQVSTAPPVAISLGGGGAGQTFRLKSASGTLTVGAGRDPKADPFKVVIRYKVAGSSISYSIDAEPWAIVRGKGGIGLGKTPLSSMAGEGSTVFELANPKEGRALRITLRFSP